MLGNKYNYRLAPNRLTKFRWTEFPKPIPDNEFSFVDWDYLTYDHSGKYARRDYRIMLGRPRYDISFHVQPKNRKKPIAIIFDFNDAGYYERCRINYNYASRKQEEKWEAEGLTRLCEIGVIEKVYFKEENNA